MNFDITEDIDDLENKLPRYEDYDGEVPNGACALVAYTVSQYTGSKKNDAVSFNIRWVLLLGDKE